MASTAFLSSSKIVRRIGLMFSLIAVSMFLACSPAETSLETRADESNVSTQETININTATTEELQRIPYVGERMAEAIIEHREKFGAFRRPEHLILLNGFSDERFRKVRHLIRVN